METIKSVLRNNKFRSAPSYDIERKKSQLCDPNCPECGGCGWVSYDVPIDHPRFGKIIPCSRRNLDAQGWGKKYGLLAKQHNLSWADVLPIPGGNAAEAAAAVRGVLERGYGWVYLWGGWGVSKTLILQVAVATALRDGYDAAYIRMEEALDYLRGGYSEGDYEQRLDWLCRVPLLCIDEVEKINEKDGERGWSNTKRFGLMDKRYMTATHGEGVTIMAGNADPSKFGGELWDRIQDGRFLVIKMVGESIRPGMTWDDGIPLERASVFDRGERASVFDRGER